MCLRFSVRHERGTKESGDRLQFDCKMVSLALIHVNRPGRMAIDVAEGDAKRISGLFFVFPPEIDADEIEITNDFPRHH